MSQGLKNLQQSARSCTRRERMIPSTHSNSNSNPPTSAYDPQEDSAIGIEDLEAEYDADGASEHSGSNSNSNHSLGSMAGYGYQTQTQSQNHNMQNMQRYQHQGHQSRLPSMDMGIDAIINRPGPR